MQHKNSLRIIEPVQAAGGGEHPMSEPATNAAGKIDTQGELDRTSSMQQLSQYGLKHCLQDNTEQELTDRRKVSKSLEPWVLPDSKKAKTGKTDLTDDLKKPQVPKLCKFSKNLLGEQLPAVSPAAEVHSSTNPLDAFELIQVVGKGAFGKVFKVMPLVYLF